MGTLLLGFSVIVRTNYAPALAIVYLAALVFIYYRKPHGVILCSSLLGIVLILPVLHNLYFGGKLIFLPTSAAVPAGLVLPPKTLLDGLRDPSVLSQAWLQFRYLIYLQVPKANFLGVSIAFHGLQIMWGATILKEIRSWRSVLNSAILSKYIPDLFNRSHLASKTFSSKSV